MQILKRRHVRFRLIAESFLKLAILAGLIPGFLLAQEDPPNKGESQVAPTVLAIVDGYPITRGAAIRMLKNTVPNALDHSYQVDPLNQEIPGQLLQLALERLIAQRVVFDYLEQNQTKISRPEIELELDQLKLNLERIGRTIETFLADTVINQAELEFEIAWKLGWNRYLSQTLTDDYLERHYRENRRQFDDSEMKVAHLLIRISEFDSTDEAIALADEVRNRLDSTSDRFDRLTWSHAVSQFSAAPTRDNDGEIGWIRFHEPMPPLFSAAAFRLKQGEISPPVVTPFGVHLIKCLELKEGKTTWRDALDDVRRDAAMRLFESLHQQHRPQVKIVIVNE